MDLSDEEDAMDFNMNRFNEMNNEDMG